MERFNSGNGGYTCDTCNVLIWGGHHGKEQPENRCYWYPTKAEDIVETDTHAFCSRDCYEHHNEHHRKIKK